MQKIKGGFTLVELIVTITILVILGTISFIAVQRYTKDSRDSVRISDIANIQQALGVYIVAVGQYPTPSNGVNITYSGGTVWTQGSVGDNVIKNLGRLNKKPVDPRYGIEYSYSVTGFKKEYVIGGVMESLGVAQLSPDLIPQVMADNETAILRGNYNEKIVQVSTGGVDYILALPSILSSDVSVLDVNDIIANKKLVYNNYSNLPSSDTSIATFQKSGGFNYTPSKVVVFSGNIASLSTVEGMRLFIHNLQDAYSGTILGNIAGYKSLLEVNDANIDAYGSNFIAGIPQFPKDLRMGIGVISTDGICGSSDGQGFTSTPSTNLCSAGNTGSVSGSGPWTWSCNTLNGGINANCSALLAVDGVCGSSNGQSFGSTPSTNLCSAGNTGSLSGSGPWSWSCNGLNGGTNASCSALSGLTISNFGSYRAWNDSSYATSCNTYKNPSGAYSYAGSTGDGVYRIDPDGVGGSAAFDVYCNMTTSGGGWTLVGKLGDPRLLPQLGTATYYSAKTDPNYSGNWLHTNYASIVGTNVMVGVMVGVGTTTGNFYQISDCGSNDASCWYELFISQNDGDSFGAWIVRGGSYNYVPSGCTSDQCPAGGGDRDHSQSYRVAIFGGDCHSSCNSSGDDTLNGLVFRDYGTAGSPSRIGNRGVWSLGTTSAGSTGLDTEISNGDYGQGGTQYKNIWIR